MGTIAQKLEYLNDTRLLLKENINKINNVLDDNSTFRSYPQELFNGYLDILNNGTDTLWNNLEKVSQTGTEAVLEGVETAPMKMVLNGNTSQDGTPTPDTPVEVKVVTGENVVSVQSKNLYTTSNLISVPTEITIIDNNSFSYEGNVSWRGITTYVNNLKKNTDYVIYFESTSNTAYCHIKTMDNITITEKYIYYFANGIPFNSGDNTSVKVMIYPRTASGTFYNIQLEEGTAKTNFVPYSKTDYPISLGTIELCKIGNYKDYFHKDSGKWYVHKEMAKIILDGINIKFVYQEQSTLPNALMISASSRPRGKSTEDSVVNTHFSVKSSGSSFTEENTIYWFMSTQMWIKKEGFTSLSAGNTWLQNNNVTLYYVLATPTEEEITNTTLISQLEAISKAKSVKDKTYVTQTNDELPFVLDVEAIKEYEVN